MKITLRDGTEFTILRVNSSMNANGSAEKRKRAWIVFDGKQDKNAVIKAFTTDNLSNVTFTNETETYTDSYSELEDITTSMTDDTFEMSAVIH